MSKLTVFYLIGLICEPDSREKKII